MDTDQCLTKAPDKTCIQSSNILTFTHWQLHLLSLLVTVLPVGKVKYSCRILTFCQWYRSKDRSDEIQYSAVRMFYSDMKYDEFTLSVIGSCCFFPCCRPCSSAICHANGVAASVPRIPSLLAHDPPDGRRGTPR